MVCKYHPPPPPAPHLPWNNHIYFTAAVACPKGGAGVSPFYPPRIVIWVKFTKKYSKEIFDNPMKNDFKIYSGVLAVYNQISL